MKLLEIVKFIITEKLILGRNERVHISIDEIDSIKDTPQVNNIFGKPNGLWYGFGNAWVRFLKYDMPEEGPYSFSSKKYAYKIYPNFEKIIVLRTMDDLDNFIDKYLNTKSDFETDKSGEYYNSSNF